ncbi:MAG: hypothetical protein J6N21_04530, partial [Butyrivibrio sp.]|nr:hypothetical protein [Butyrivibrio sp.]
LKLTYNLADSFSSANRYLLEKESFDEKDVRYAFKELPQMEKGSGDLIATEKTKFECMPSATYQAVIFESVLGGIKALSLDKINDNENKFQALDKYMTESFKAKPELAGMIFKYFVEAQDAQMSVEDLKEEFTYVFSNVCLIPSYRDTDFSVNEATFFAIQLQSPGSTFNDYLTEQFENIKKTQQSENDGKENDK